MVNFRLCTVMGVLIMISAKTISLAPAALYPLVTDSVKNVKNNHTRFTVFDLEKRRPKLFISTFSATVFTVLFPVRREARLDTNFRKRVGVNILPKVLSASTSPGTVSVHGGDRTTD